MALDPLLRVLAASAFLLLPAAAWSAGEEPPSPPAASQSAAAETAKAQALFKAGRFEEALAILRPLAAARPGHLDTRFPGRHGGARRVEETGHRRGEARSAVGRGHRGLPHHADRGPRPGARPPGACPGFLPEGRGQAGHAAFRAGAGRQAAGAGGAQRQPVPVSDAGAKALEPAPRHGAGAGQQYLQPVGRADDRARHPHRTASVYLSGGGRGRIRYRHLGLGPAGNTSTRWRTAGGCARAPTSRAASTARTSSTK